MKVFQIFILCMQKWEWPSSAIAMIRNVKDTVTIASISYKAWSCAVARFDNKQPPWKSAYKFNRHGLLSTAVCLVSTDTFYSRFVVTFG